MALLRLVVEGVRAADEGLVAVLAAVVTNLTDAERIVRLLEGEGDNSLKVELVTLVDVGLQLGSGHGNEGEVVNAVLKRLLSGMLSFIWRQWGIRSPGVIGQVLHPLLTLAFPRSPGVFEMGRDRSQARAGGSPKVSYECMRESPGASCTGIKNKERRGVQQYLPGVWSKPSRFLRGTSSWD